MFPIIIRSEGIRRYLSPLRARGSDYPISLLAKTGVDLSRPDTVRAVAVELKALVARFEIKLDW
jgi:oligoendopeptidase F